MTNHFKILNRYFGYTSFRPGQEEIITSIISGRNVLAILPTGGGKSLCYQIPAIGGERFSIVISPLIALMKDQVDSLNKKENIAAFINSTLSYSESEEIFNGLQSGKIKILYVSPEKLENSEFAKRIKSMNPQYLFIDEAHCISQWGHNFRPSYKKINEFAKYIDIKNISAFTATATPIVRDDIIKQLRIENPEVFIQGFERENISINVFTTKYKKEKTAEILAANRGPAIVYTATRKNAEELTEFLKHSSIDSQYYHAGLAPEMRRLIQDDFILGRLNIIVATNAFGMGIDKSNIRTIVHYNMPGSIESYYQEIGRAGRDGKKSKVYLLYDLRDTSIQKYFIESSFPSKDEIEYVYDCIYDHGSVAIGNRPEKEIQLDENFNIKLKLKNISAAKFNSIIKVLEESSYIKLNPNFYKNHYLRFILNQKELKEYTKKISNNFNKEVIITLLREYSSILFDSKSVIDISKLSKNSQTEEKQIINILENLNRIGIVDYESPSDFNSVKILETRVPLKSININYSSIEEMMDFEKKKLKAVIDLVYSEECRFKYILEYFGESVNNYRCGNCDVCSGTSGINNNTNEYLEEIILQAVSSARHPYKENTLLKILLGNSKSPAVQSNPFFAKCANYKKEEILSAIGALVSKNEIIKTIDTLTLSEESISKMADFEEARPSASDNKGYEKTLLLFNKLREARKTAAIKYSQNTNLICRDEILREIAKEKPNTAVEFLAIEGTNKRMFNKIGDEFLEIIKEEVDKESIKNKDVPDNIIKTLELVKKGYSLSDISSLTRLPEAVVSMQIETIIDYYPETNTDSLFSKKEFELINQEIKNGVTNLKELKELLPNSISYGKIRIALAKNKFN